jgi:hypothetical protein
MKFKCMQHIQSWTGEVEHAGTGLMMRSSASCRAALCILRQAKTNVQRTNDLVILHSLL